VRRIRALSAAFAALSVVCALRRAWSREYQVTRLRNARLRRLSLDVFAGEAGLRS